MEKEELERVKQGKKNREAGQRFEMKVRKDLESKGWIVDRWSNNVEFGIVGYTGNDGDIPLISKEKTKLIPAKHKFRGPGIPMAIGTGFPDFIAFRYKGIIPETLRDKIVDTLNNKELIGPESADSFEIIGVEVKSNGYLTKEEKEKCKWLLDHHVFSKILIAKKSKKRGKIIYEDFSEKYGNKSLSDL